MKLTISGSQIIGKRDLQEDAFYFDTRVDDGGQQIALAVLADGVGGHGSGNVASQLAVSAFADYVWAAIGDAATKAHFAPVVMPGYFDAELDQFVAGLADRVAQALRHDDSPRGVECLENPAVVLMGALCFANDQLNAEKSRLVDREAMACTLVAVLAHDAKFWWISVGDSHVYLVRDRNLEKKNAVHDYGSILDAKVAAGEPVSDAEAHYSRKTLVSSVSGDALTLIDCPDEPMRLRDGDCIVLASDGLNGLSAARIVFQLVSSEGAQSSAVALLDAVQRSAHPRQDNTTVVVMQCLAPDVVAGDYPTKGDPRLCRGGSRSLTEEGVHRGNSEA